MANVFDQFDAPPATPPASGNVFDQFDAPVAKAQPAPTASEPEDTGFSGAFTAGIGQAFRGIGQTAQTVTGGRPTGEAPNILAAQPTGWADLLHPKTLGEKAVYQLAEGSPTMAAFMAGSLAGGGPEEPAGIATGAIAAGAMSVVQSLGPGFAEQLKASPNDPEGAFDRAVKTAAAEGVLSGIGFAAFSWAPFKSTAKNLLFQAFGVQPGVAMTGKATTNVLEGRPVEEGIADTYPGAALGTILPATAFGAAHAFARHALGLPKTGTEEPPARGETPASEAPGAESPSAGSQEPGTAPAHPRAANEPGEPTTGLPPQTALDEFKRLSGVPETVPPKVAAAPEPVEAEPEALPPKGAESATSGAAKELRDSERDISRQLPPEKASLVDALPDESVADRGRRLAVAAGELAETHSAEVERAGLLNGPAALPPSEISGAHAAPGEGIPDRGVSDAVPSPELREGPAVVPESERLVERPREATMQPDVGARAEDGQIPGRVVEPVPVDVMHDLTPEQRAAQDALHDQTMLGNLPAVPVDVPVKDASRPMPSDVTAARSAAHEEPPEGKSPEEGAHRTDGEQHPQVRSPQAAEIARTAEAENQERTEQAVAAAETPKPIPGAPKPDDVLVKENEQHNGVEVRFKAKPSPEVLEALKRAGFKWSSKQKLWYAKRTPETLDVANRLKAEPAKTPAENIERIADLAAERDAAERGEPVAGSPSRPFAKIAEDEAARGGPEIGQYIGQNAEGKPLFEDARGVRSIAENGVRHTEPVQMIPTREGMKIGVDRTAHPEFATTEETHGLQEPVRPSVAGEGPRDLPQAAPERGDGLVPAAEEPGGARAAGPDPGARAEEQGRPAEEPGGGARGGGEGAGHDAGVPGAGERAPGAARGPEADNALEEAALSVFRAYHRGGPDAANAEFKRIADNGGIDKLGLANRAKEMMLAGGWDGSSTGTARTQKPDAKVTGRNFSIEPGAVEEARGPKQKAEDNLTAIALAKQIVSEDRPATHAEQALLAKYVGWGGLAGAFEGSDGRFGKGFETLGAKLKNLLGEEEYRAAARSTQYAHYTAERVIRAMWDAVERMGFKGGSVFEPGMGVGHFLGMMPRDLAARTHYQGLEMDHLTAQIAKLLYPESGVRHADYIRTPMPEGSFDLVIGNPPFSDTVVKGDPKYGPRNFLLHDYFFAKSLDSVRPGGLLGFVTAAGTMNKIDASARQYLAGRAEFVGGVRLPDTAFKQNAGTEVTTDILFFQKRPEIVPHEDLADRTWTETVARKLPDSKGGMTEGNVSRYFSEHPEQVLGEEGFFDKLYQGRYAVHARDGADLETDLRAALERLPADVMKPPLAPEQKAALDFESGQKKDGSFYLKDGQLYQYREGVGRPVMRRGAGVEGGMTQAARERIQHLIPIRDALRDVFAHDLAERGPEAEAARKVLNESYDGFVKKYGPLNKAEFQYRRPNIIQEEGARAEMREEVRERGGEFDEGSFDPTVLMERHASLQEIARARKAAREAAKAEGKPWNEGTFDPDAMEDVVLEKRPNIDPFMDDPESYRLRSIEHYDDHTGATAKKLIFSESVLKRESEPELKSAEDGVLWSLNKHGRLDLDAIANRMMKDRQTIIDALGEKIFKLPGTEGTYHAADEYLSGDVKTKLEEARAAAVSDPEVRRNVEALEHAQPKPLSPGEISMELGMPWMPPELYRTFARDKLRLGEPGLTHSPTLGQWFVDGAHAGPTEGAQQWRIPERGAHDLLADAMNRTPPRIYLRDADGKPVFDPVATQAAADKILGMKEAFQEWMQENPDHTERMAALYNEKLNRVVLRQYDGAYMTTPGISKEWSWRPHQTRVVSRIVLAGNTYMAHAVGAGKTSAMIGAGMEMRRLGLARKPMYVVPNHMLGQFTKEFYEQYPTARIAVADDRRFHTSRRKQFMANVAQDDVDAVIITNSSFGKIPISDEFQTDLIHEELDKLDEALSGLNKGTDRITIKKIENQKEKLQQKLLGRQGTAKDQTNSFEEMGVDFLFVDEAHQFRKLAFATKQNLKGIDPEGSGMAWDLYTKLRYLESKNPGRSAVLASGTPVTNTMGELYTISRYLQQPALDGLGLGHFDSWANTFGDAKTALEQTASGDYQSVTRFSKFVNIPELYKMVGSVMDIVTPNQLEQYVTRPKLKGGERQLHLAPKTPELMDYQDELRRRVEAIKNRKGPPQKGDDILLSVINDGRHAAIDMRYVNPMIGSGTNSKLNQMIGNIHRVWQETKDTQFYNPASGYKDKAFRGPATQMVFMNFGVGDAREFSGYKFLKQELVRRGVPAKEIAFIKDFAKSPAAKQKAFNDMNEGKIRILVGSTQKMGTGVNAQRRLVALHNEDPMWYPADDEQRVGRGLRQGNFNPELEVHDYGTEGTYDSTMWQMMGRKGRFIEQFFRGDPDLRDIEDLGEASTYEQASAMTTADPRVMRLTEMREQLAKLERRQSAHDRSQYSLRHELADYQDRLKRLTESIPQYEQDIAQRQDTKGDKFAMDVGGKSYTKRVEAAGALKKQFELEAPALKIAAPARAFGSIGGFPLLIERPTASRYDFYLKRTGFLDKVGGASDGADGLVQSAEARLRSFEEGLDYLKQRQALAEQTLETIRPQLGKEFLGGEDISSLRKQVKDLEAELAPKKPDQAPPTMPVGVAQHEPPAAPGTHQDRSAEFAAFVKLRAATDQAALNKAAADWVVERGQATGHEHTAIIDSSGTEPPTASTSSEPDFSLFSEETTARLNNPDNRVILHHNHPRSLGLSGIDLIGLARPGLAWVVAHAHDGHLSAARLTPAARAFVERVGVSTAELRLRALTKAARDAANTALERAQLSEDTQLQLAAEAMNGALAQAKLIDYMTTREPDPRITQWAAAALRAASDVVQRRAPRLGFKTEKAHGVLPDPRSWTLRADEAMGRLSGPDAEAAAGQSAGAVGGGGREGGTGAPEEGSGAGGDSGPPKGPRGGVASDDGGRDEMPRAARDGPLGRGVAQAHTVWRRALDGALDIGADLQAKLAPMATGEDRAKATAKQFANAERLAHQQTGRLIDTLNDKYRKTPDRYREMFDALDEQSDYEQKGERPPEGEGLHRLTPGERADVKQLDAMLRGWFDYGVSQGMFEGPGIPSYAPRKAILMMEGMAERLPGGPKGAKGSTGAVRVGANLQTESGHLRARKYQTIGETEEALKAKYGEHAEVVRDIRVLPLVMGELQRVIAGRALINKIEAIGRETGQTLVATGETPGDGHKWKTLQDHPSFEKWEPRLVERAEPGPRGGQWETVKRPDGSLEMVKRPILIRDDWWGPVSAVLARDSGKAYQAFMEMKGKAMSAIMYSPLIHVGVELGRAFPAMPGKLFSIGFWKRGNAGLENPDTMRRFIMGGLVPIGHWFGYQDITSVMNQPHIAPGKSWTAQVLGAVPGLFDPKAGDAVKRAVDRMGDVYHNTLLWDRVAQLQMGLALEFEQKFLGKGMNAHDATVVAAHMANRFAGALPKEAMSSAARKIANFLFFSRTFTLGNLGVMKDALTGLPRDVQAQITQESGAIANQYAKTLARRKALAVVATDMLLFHVGNALLQSAIAVMSGTSDAKEEGAGYLRRMQQAMQSVAEDPLKLLNPMGLVTQVTPQGENEPGKQDRVLVGHAADGTAVYMRNPFGKIGEEFEGWLTGPLDMLRRKMGTVARPISQLIANDQGFAGRKVQVYDPNPRNEMDLLKNLGNIVGLFVGDQIPLQSITAARDLIAGRGNAAIENAQVFAPLGGVTVSKGFPGGEAEGLIAAAKAEQEYRVQQAMPGIKRTIQDGNVSEAQKRMTELGLDPGLQRWYVQNTQHPRQMPSRKQLQEFMRTAPPEQKRLLQMYLDRHAVAAPTP